MPKARVRASRRHKRTPKSRLMINLKRILRTKSQVEHTDLRTPLKIGDIPTENFQKQFKPLISEQIFPDQILLSSQNNSEIEENLPDIEYETDVNYKNPLNILEGRRIVDLAHLLNEYEKVIFHSKKCTLGKMELEKETRNGLVSKLHFYCTNCERTCVISTDPVPVNNNSNLNKSVVWGNLSTGLGHTQCEELLSVLNIPFMSSKTYTKLTADVKKFWEYYLSEEMKKAGEDERKIALEKGHVTNDGTPYITVIADGGWSKRTYGHGYNAPSGVGVIIGSVTKKPLFLGVRNKVCSTCSYYEGKNISAKLHHCSKNFSGPSTAMEQDIIVEGFAQSIVQHGVIYKYFIGDGDSSVYARIVEKVPYGRQVIKIECANHMTRCASDKLHKLASNTKYSIQSRKILTEKVNNISRLERLVKGIRTAIKNNFENSVNLREDLANAPYHVLGRHSKCRNTFCNPVKQEEDLVNKIDSSFFIEIKKILEPLINKADQLVYNATTNQAERYMSLVVKCSGGKRINFSKRWSYTARAYAAGILHTHGPGWHSKAWVGAPPKYLNLVCDRKRKIAEKRQQAVLPKKKKMKSAALDKHYGPDAVQPDIDNPVFLEKKQLFLGRLAENCATKEKISEIEEATRGQHDNSFWREIRKSYLTASNFGIVIKRRSSTHCHNLVKRLLYTNKELLTLGILFGRTHESVAIAKYESYMNVVVKRCGFFIDANNPFLGASPDGLVGENGIIEVKCLASVDKLLEKDGRNVCYTIDGNQVKLKTSHNYYYQIQGQLAILKRDFCDFILFTKTDFHVERIYRDDEVWENTMMPKLRSFYYNCILPEIIDGRIPRGMKIRDVDHSDLMET